jgi:hypothetical protein
MSLILASAGDLVNWGVLTAPGHAPLDIRSFMSKLFIHE